MAQMNTPDDHLRDSFSYAMAAAQRDMVSHRHSGILGGLGAGKSYAHEAYDSHRLLRRQMEAMQSSIDNSLKKSVVTATAKIEKENLPIRQRLQAEVDDWLKDVLPTEKKSEHRVTANWGYTGIDVRNLTA